VSEEKMGLPQMTQWYTPSVLQLTNCPEKALATKKMNAVMKTNLFIYLSTFIAHYSCVSSKHFTFTLQHRDIAKFSL
jgi:hypothetical protein